MGKRFRFIPQGSPIAQLIIGEGIGTFFLALIVVCAVVHAGPFAPIAIGFGLASLVFSYGYVSKAQYNPAVSLALCTAGAQSIRDTVAAVVTQLVTGVAGALIGAALLPKKAMFPALAPLGATATWDDHGDVGRAFLAEFVFTFNLAHTVLNVAASRQGGNHFFGLAIGMAVLTGAFSVGAVSGAALNPAVALGLQLTHAIIDAPVPASGVRPIQFIWLYWLAEVLGGVVAGLVFHFIENDGHGDDTCNDADPATVYSSMA